MVHHETTFFHRKLWTTKPDRIRVRVPPQRLPAMGVCCMSNLIEPQQTLVFFGLFSHIWLVVWNMWIIFPHIGNFIIPTDSDIFQRGRSTTNQILIGFNIINQLFLWENQLFNYGFPYFGNNNPIWRTPSFFRGVGLKPPTRSAYAPRSRRRTGATWKCSTNTSCTVYMCRVFFHGLKRLVGKMSGDMVDTI